MSRVSVHSAEASDSIAETDRSKDEENGVAEAAWNIDGEGKRLEVMTTMTTSLFLLLMCLSTDSLAQFRSLMMMSRWHWNSVVVDASTDVIYSLRRNPWRCQREEVNDVRHDSRADFPMLNGPSAGYHNDPNHRRNHRHCLFRLLRSRDLRPRNSVRHTPIHLRYSEDISSFV